MIRIVLQETYYKPLIVSLISFIIIYLTPILSHILPIPVSLFEPMRIVLLAGYFYARNKHSSFIIALTLPVFSFWITGHPLVIKSLIISIELIVNLHILVALLKNSKIPLFVAISVSIILSKIIYYFMKAIFNYLNIITGPIITTPLIYQLLAVILITICFTIILNMLNKKK